MAAMQGKYVLLSVERCNPGIRMHSRSAGDRGKRFIRPAGRLLLLAGLVTGCSLQERTVDIGRSVGAIYTGQILENLYTLADDPRALPSIYSISKGSIQTNHSVNPGVTVPLGNTVTREATVGGVSEVVGAYNALTLQYTGSLVQSWDIVPAKDSSALRRLRAVYRFALGQIDESELSGEVKGLPPGSVGMDMLLAVIEHCADPAAKRKGGCFKVASLQSMQTPCARKADEIVETTILADQSFVCVSKYNTFHDDFFHQRSILVLRDSYKHDVLPSLVLLSLELQAEGEREAAAKDKYAQTIADEDAKYEPREVAGAASLAAATKWAETAAAGQCKRK